MVTVGVPWVLGCRDLGRPLRRPRPLANLSFRLGLLLNEVPIAGLNWLLIATLLAFGQGDIGSPGGRVTVGLAGVAAVGLGVIARRGLRAGDRARLDRGPGRRLQDPS
jgi:hypothetical protein